MSGKVRFAVTGMTCAACSARVEKATAGVPGVSGVAVNLLKNSMEVQLGAEADPAATSAAIVAAVEKAGYGAFRRAKAQLLHPAPPVPPRPAPSPPQALPVQLPPSRPSARACCSGL